MALYVKNDEVNQLAGEVAAALRVTKTEAIRLALVHELERVQAVPSLVERAEAFVEALHRKAHADRGAPADKAFIDSLYGED
jgi:antitoxin VapB